jgi:maltooligosyltrehalose trehalohydrolase
VRRGRKEEFTAFQWEGELPDPQDEATFFWSKLRLDQHENGRHKVLFDFYKNLIKLRKEVFPLSHSSKTGTEIRAFSGSDVVLMKCEDDLDRATCIFNFSGKDIEIEPLMDRGFWQRVLDSSSSEWGGPGSPAPESIQSIGSNVSLKLNSYSFVLYRCLDKRV